MKISSSLAALPLLLLAGEAVAQTGTPLPVIPGYNAFTGCPSLNLTPCFVPQGAVGSGIAGYPPGATPQGATNSGTTSGTSASLPAVVGQYTYLCGFSVSPGSATSATTLAVSLTAVTVVGGATWAIGAPVTAAGTTGAIFTQTFSPCIRTNVTDQNPGVSVSSLGTGGVNQAVSVWGYTQ